MDATRLPEVSEALEKEILPDAFEFLVQVGEIPYRANRRAMVELDLHHNAIKGLKKVQAAIGGIDGWIGELELFRDAAQRVARKAVAVFRSS